jgi:choloylglycine hydrolase
MDWSEAPDPDLWVLPSGVKRKAMAKLPGKKQFKWVSEFSSIVTSNYDIATSDGINSKGLTTNLLWLAQSDYPRPVTQEDKSPMCMSIWAQYLLDTCATVADTLLAMDQVYILSAPVAGREGLATCHLSVGDQDGNSAIFEYIDGQLVTYSNIDNGRNQSGSYLYSKKEMRVMTNDPGFNRQIDSLVYWDELNDVYQKKDSSLPALLPGSNLALNRFIRASYYSDRLLDNVSNTMALAGLSTVLNNNAQPPLQLDQGNSLSRTQYTTFADCKDLQYFYRSNYSPFLIWINLKDVDFSKLENDEVYKLPLNQLGVLESTNQEFGNGNITDQLVKAKMFDFVPAAIPGS